MKKKFLLAFVAIASFIMVSCGDDILCTVCNFEPVMEDYRYQFDEDYVTVDAAGEEFSLSLKDLDGNSVTSTLNWYSAITWEGADDTFNETSNVSTTFENAKYLYCYKLANDSNNPGQIKETIKPNETSNYRALSFLVTQREQVEKHWKYLFSNKIMILQEPAIAE